MSSNFNGTGVFWEFEGRTKYLFLFFVFFITGFRAWGQTSMTSIPEADENGEIHVCLGSVVLFSHDTPEWQLVGATSFNWDFDYNNQTASTAGPHAILFDSFGSYDVSLSIITYDGDEDLGEQVLTVVVDEVPPMVPLLGPGNPCTFTDTLYDDTGAIEQIIFQTQNGEASCTCFNDNVGPAVSMLDTDQYPDGTVSHMWWGGAGTTGPSGTGGTAPYTTENGPFPLDDPAIFNGQNVFGHYADQGSYNLMHVVDFPNGCTYSSYYVMSWGAAEIDFGSSQAQSVCFPLEYPLGFDIQSPGTTYQIEWGDGDVDEYVYPDLPVLPNVIGHQYAPSCDSIGEAEAYTITVRASNACTVDTTITTQGPFYVSTPPTPDFEMIPGDVVCQFDTIVFSELVQAGFEASGGSCSNDHLWEWWIEGENDLVGDGYEVIAGGMGDIFNLFALPVSGTEQIEVYFDEPGYYTVTLSVLNDFCNPTSISKTVLINPVPQVEDLELTICNFSGFDTLPGPPNIVPPGTIFDWTVQPNPNVEGDSNGSGTSIYAGQLINTTNVPQTVIYDVIPTAPGNCVGEPFAVTVEVVPGIEISDYTVVVCNGDGFSIDPATTPGNIVPDVTVYEWTITDNPNIGGASSSTTPQNEIAEDTLTTSVIQPAQFVEYHVTASVGFGCDDDVFSIAVYVNDVDAGIISEDQLICPGGDPLPFVFTQNAIGSGTSLDYQWQQYSELLDDWLDIDSETGISYDPPSGMQDDAYYRVIVTSTLFGVSCTDTTNVVHVEISNISQPQIQPDQVLCAGEDPSIIELVDPIDAFGEVTYQWQSAMSSAGPWNDIFGQTNESFEPPPLNDDLYVRVIVSSTSDEIECALVSEHVFLDVNAVYAGTLSPDQTICEGEIPGIMTVNAPSGQGAISFQWYNSSTPDGTFEIIPGAVQSTYQPDSGLIDDIYYHVEVMSNVSGVVCSDWTNEIWVQVNNVDSGAVPSVQHVCEGGDPFALEFLQLPEGDGDLTYQWQSSTDGEMWTSIQGAMASSYDPPNGLQEDTDYQVLFTSTVNGVVCTIESPLFQINVLSLDPGTISEGQQICAGGDPDQLIANVAPNGEGILSYQWQETTDLSAPWVDIQGANGLNYNPPGPILETTFYQLVVTNTIGVVSCTEFTEPIVVEVYDDPAFLIQPLAFQEICVGGVVGEFEVLVEMDNWLGEVSYQWYDENGIILNATDSTYTPPIFTSDGTNEFYVEVNWSGDGCDGMTSDIAEVQVVPDPMVIDQPISATYCMDAETTELVISADGGAGSFEYQWWVNDVPSVSGAQVLPDETAAAYTPPTDQVGTFYYFCEVTQTEEGCSVFSELAQITVVPTPVISSQPMADSVCVNGFVDALFIEFEEGEGIPIYQWFSNSVPSMAGAIELLGETGPTYIPPTDVIGTTWYTVVLNFSEGGCGSVTADWVDLVVTPSPVIVLDPLQSDTICAGGSLLLPLDVTYIEGTGEASYQWYTGDGTEISGATESAFMPPGFDAPGTFEFYVQVSLDGNGCVPAISQTAEVVVVADSYVILQPSDTSYCQFAAPVIPLEVAVEGGTGAYSYQWYESPTASTTAGDPIPGATSSTYVPSVDAVGTLYYYCIITQSGANCEVVSDYAAIETNEAPEFTMTLLNQEVCLGGALDAYTVTYMNGTGIPSYQWYSNTVNSTSGGTELVGETAPTYQPSSDALGEIWYFCEVSFSFGGCDMIASPPVSVSVFTDPLISVSPLVTDTLCMGGSPFLALEVQYTEGAGTPSYQWYLIDGTPIDGATTSTYLPPSFDLPGTYSYYAEVSVTGNGCAAVQSAEAEVVVVADPVVTLQPSDTSYCQFAAPVIPLEVAVEGGTGTYSYQWYESTTASTTAGDPIPSATSSTYVPPVEEVGTLYYYCIVTQSGANCQVVSDYAAIVTNEAPEFTMTLVDQEVCLDGTLDSYTVTYTNGTGVPSYQWYSNTVNSTLGGTLLTGETSSTYQPLSEAVGATWYYCEVSFSFGGCDMITSTPVLVNVVADPVISLEPLATDTLCVGGSPYLPLEVAYEEGTGTPTYQWFLGDGTAIGGATASTYLPPSYDTPGTYTYYAEVTLSGSGCDMAQSAEAEAVVVADPVVTLQPSDTSYCQFAAPVIPFEVAVEGGSGTYSYQWYESTTAGTTGGDPIPGATSSTYVPPVDEVGTLYYYCIITQSGANCEVVSDYAAIVTNEAPEFTTQPLAQTLCSGEAPNLLEVAYQYGTGIPSYQWYENTVSNYAGTPIPGATNPSYQPLGATPGSLYYYCVITFDGGGCDLITSVIAGVHVNNIVIGSIAADQAICSGQAPEALLQNIQTTGGGTLFYQWLEGVDGTSDLNAISGAIADGYAPPALFDTTYYLLEVSSVLNTVACIDTTNAVEVIVYPLPEISIGPADVYCVNDGIQELTEFSPIGGVWEGPGVTDAAAGLFEVDGPQTGVGEWDLFFWYEDLVTGCRDTLDHEVTVNPMPTAAFEVPELACNNFPIAIDQNSVDAALATWDFGNGDASGDILPVYTYPDPGVYNIELIVENGFGCLDTSFAGTEITYLPQADFSISNNEGCAPFIIEFTNLSDAPFSTHEWMLGDSLFEGVTPDSTLFEQGPELELYDVVLSVSNVCGTTSETQTVSVIPVPQMSFLLLEDTACSPFTPDILNTSVGLPDQIEWDFGNGQTESGTITDFPTYFVDPDSSATTFFITVVGTNECGTDSYTAPIVIQPNTIQAFFAVDQDEGCAPLAVSATDLSFETTESIFDFGNGQVSYDQESSTVYEDPGTYVITQYVTNGCSLDTTYYEIEVWPQPDYTLSSDQPNYCEGETVSLTLSSDEPTSAVWQFGQGDSDTGLNVSTVYVNDGTYFVNAEVTSGINGCVANGTLPVTILPTPELAIDAGLEGGCSPLIVSFENNSSDADFWNWDFGDGQESGATAPTYTFVNPDQEPIDYTIMVYASNLEGCEATTQLDLTILPAPEVGIGGIEDQYCGVPASVYPENLSQYAIDYQWEVDGQLVSTAFEPDLTFESSGVFALELTAFNEYDCPTTAIEFVLVNVNPIPALNLSPLDGCPPLDVYLQDASVGAFSELTITYEEEVVYQGPPTTNYYLFEWSGIYTLGLEVTSGDGCTVNEPELEVITVHPEPFALFEMVPYDADSGPDIPSSLNTQWTFLNLSNDNSLNYWQFGDGAVSTEVSPTHKYNDPGVYGVSLLVTNDFGCNSTHSEWVVIEEQTPVYVPNSFTPGGVTSKPDGLNDAFRAEFRDYELITDYSLQIFDRWGELIWESSDPEEFWRGNVRRDGYESEHFVKLDVYTWKIRYSSIAMKGTHRELTGHVTIVR